MRCSPRISSSHARSIAPWRARVDHVRIAIGACRGLFDGSERSDVVRIFCEDTSGESQILDSSDRMNSVKRVCWDSARAEQIFFDASAEWCGEPLANRASPRC